MVIAVRVSVKQKIQVLYLCITCLPVSVVLCLTNEKCKMEVT